MNQVFCQSCGMPITESSLLGTEASGEKNQEYCIYCYQDGKFKQPDMTMDEMIQFCVPFMVENRMKEEEAFALLQQTMPFLKRWRKDEPIDEPRFVFKQGFLFSGICTRSNNAVEAAPNGEIPKMWDRYFSQRITDQIQYQVKPSETIALYSDYESDFNGDYDFSIGTTVENTGNLSNDLVSKSIPASTYAVFTTKVGKINEIIPMAWMDIWKWFETAKVERTYTGDFELYDERCANPEQAQVDIYIAIKE
ncbi:zinc ribbon domain-containing protein [Heyndrickxia sporothermodurans]